MLSIQTLNHFGFWLSKSYIKLNSNSVLHV